MADTEQDDISITEGMGKTEYYHGMLPRVDIEPLLKEDGDFILRKTEVNGSVVLAISVLHKAAVKHFMVNQNDDKTFYIEDHAEKTVAELIEYFRVTKKPLSVTCEARLKRPIPRPEWLLNHDSIVCSKKLGEGAFGEVYLGTLKTTEEPIKVAVKTMRGEANRDARTKFMHEARLMRKFKHPNVVLIHGVAVYEAPLMIVMEFCPGGSLLSYLRNNKGKLTAEVKLKFVTEAAQGMAFLEEKKCVHRDVAARNCLLTVNNDLKISDFGMSDERQIILDVKLQKVPVKWLAKETLESKVYTMKTDVWSYAILCWEVYADGAEPYPGLNNLQTRAKIVVQDYRMKIPECAPPAVAKVINACWHKDAKERPEFAKVVKLLKSVKL
ncbi:protein tyrosine kinase domain-containing protein [Ditylenchus destructor]|nr:protein tyrosine kinase domain-containing protein [Ditylenchus destructor]